MQKNILCKLCLKKINPITSHIFGLTKNKNVTVYAVSAYVDPLKTLIQKKNFKNPQTFYALGNIIWNQTPINTIDFDIIVPIPLHWSKYASRWFNQAEIMATVIQKKSCRPLMPFLKKTYQKATQVGLLKKERHKNIEGTLILNKKYINYKNKNILIIDDVMTTGSTLKEACKALLPLEPKSITCAVVCRVI